jgi:hypothetical protein
MKIGDGEATRRALFIRLSVLLLMSGATLPGSLWAQNAAGKPMTANSSSSQNPDGTGALGFSIESEMLTYRALESDSEAVACDVAAYLRGGSATFTNPPAGSVCTVTGGTENKAGIIILPFDPEQLNDFRMWRADMLTMSELLARSQTFCPANQAIEVTPKGAVPSILGATPVASALSLVQAGLGLVSSQASITPVGGTIQDQAFMDGVARDLRSLSVPVLMPSTFLPNVLSPIDPAHSPFLQSLDKLYTARRCLLGKTSENDPAIAQLVEDIDSYLAAVTGSPAVKVASAPGSAPTSTSNSPPGAGASKPAGSDAGAQGPENGNAAAAGSPSHLMSVLSADSLAQKLGVSPQTGLMPANGSPQHILLLEALESGGSVEKHSNILGTKIRYSGGSAGTYALFTMDGELECSGNVYEYGGLLPAKDFEKGLRDYVPAPSKQYIFQRGSCQAPVAH